jgi:glutathione S-transferase
MNRLTLYQHPFASYCWKALIALYELGVPFASHLVDGDDGRRELAAIWPMASIPVLRDETARVTVPASSAIVEYVDGLAGPAGTLIPSDRVKAIEARLWDRVVDDYVATPMQKIVADSLRAEGERDAVGVAQAREALGRAYAMLDGRVADGAWLAGDFSIADCAAAPALFYARVVHAWDEPRLARLTGYYRALMHRPSVRRVIDEARPYRHLFPLPWPEDVDAHQPGGGSTRAGAA